MLFYIPTNDAAIYLQGGKTIIDGGKIYVDFIDIKSPIFFSIYAIINLLSFNNLIIFNILLYIVYIFTSFLFYIILKKYVDNIAAISSSIILSISILTLNIGLNIHPEILISSLFILSTLFYINSIERNSISLFSSNSSYLIYHSIILALIVSIKYTFIFIYLCYILYDYLSLHFTYRQIIKRNINILLTFVVSTIIFHFWLFDKEILFGYLETLKYIKFYGSIPPISINLFKEIIKNTGIFFGDNFSLPFSFLAFFGIFQYLISQGKKRNYFIELNLILFLFLLLSIFVERKTLIYHYGRLFIPLSVLAGYAFSYLYLAFKALIVEKKINKYKTFAIIFICIFFIFTSQIPRYIYVWSIAIMRIQNEPALLKMLDNANPNSTNYYEKYKIANYLNQKYAPQTKILIVSIGEFDLIYKLKHKILKALPQRSNILSEYVNPFHFKLFLDELKIADVLVVQKNDIFYFLTGNYLSSYQSLKKNPIVSNILNSQFHIVFEDEVNVIFERNR